MWIKATKKSTTIDSALANVVTTSVVGEDKRLKSLLQIALAMIGKARYNSSAADLT
jgi:hypothetical protein